MNAVQVPLVVEAILILVTMTLGTLLGRMKKPYGKVKLPLHLFFAVWFAFGYYFVAQTVWTSQGFSGTGIAVLVMGIALLVQVLTGVRMLVAKWGPQLPLVHGTSAVLVLVSDAVAYFLSGS